MSDGQEGFPVAFQGDPEFTCDVAAIGGGPAGCAVAFLLARAGLSVLLLGPPAGTEERLGETLPPIANEILRDLGIWDRFRGEGHLPSEGIVSIWADSQPRFHDFFLSDPLSSLGIYKALDSGRQASETILGLFRGRDPGPAYQQWSRDVFGHYLGHRARFYAQREGPTGSPFWARRQSVFGD
jgi:flavin-dependent dehydrogenase